MSIHSLEGETPVNIVDAVIQLKSSTLRYISFVIAQKINILVNRGGMEKQCVYHIEQPLMQKFA